MQDGPGTGFGFPHRRQNTPYDDYLAPGLSSRQGVYYNPPESLSAKESDIPRSGHHNRHHRRKEPKYSDEGLSYTSELHAKQDSGYALPYTTSKKTNNQKSHYKSRHHVRQANEAKKQRWHNNIGNEERPNPLYTEMQMGIIRPSRPQRSAQPNRLSQFVSSSQARFKVFRGYVGDYLYRRQ